MGDLVNDLMVIPSMGPYSHPNTTKGTSFSYDLICGKAEEEVTFYHHFFVVWKLIISLKGRSGVKWSEVTKVYINNLKFHEEIQISLSRFLKTTLRPGLFFIYFFVLFLIFVDIKNGSHIFIGALVFTLVELPYWQRFDCDFVRVCGAVMCVMCDVCNMY